MADVFVGFGSDRTGRAAALLAAAAGLDPVQPPSVIKVVSDGFKVPEEVADAAGAPRYPAAECPP